MTAPRIREAGPEDAPALSVLAAVTYARAFGHSFTPSDLTARLATALSPGAFEQAFRTDTILVAEVEDRPVGYVRFGELPPGSDHGDAELRQFYVLPEFQRQGIGGALMEATLAHPRLRRASHLYLDVWERNTDARRFYERFGFVTVGVRPFAVASGAATDPDLWMLRRIPPVAPGRIIVLNGTPRSGKSRIAEVIQATFNGVWMNLGVDRFMAATPERFRPGIGLRPGGERPDLEPIVATLYAALYDSIAAHSRLGLNVVTDIGHHDDYSLPRGILTDAARRLTGLPVLFVGVRCPIDVIMERRRSTGWNADLPADAPIPPPVLRWQTGVHRPGLYDLEVDTSVLTPEECAARIRERSESGEPSTALFRAGQVFSRPPSG
ncbi:MAG: GNAT family N-acetyltransferase [Capsulimonadales bacterium]|nr:GNAT family N-acetyltransferase [Capsulimonadales bacterium]